MSGKRVSCFVGCFYVIDSGDFGYMCCHVLTMDIRLVRFEISLFAVNIGKNVITYQ